jgi:hypothetical protein
MADKSKNEVVVSSTKQSKIVKYDLEKDVVRMRVEGDSYQTIADACNSSGKVPQEDPIDKYCVMRFLEKVPHLDTQITVAQKKKLAESVSDTFDIIFEVTSLFHKTKTLLELMEDDAISKGRYIDPYRFKAVVSEMRELLLQMTNIQKEVNDYNNIRKFMEIVLNVLQDEAPQAIPSIVDKLKMVKGTQWFAEIINRGGKGV